MLSTYWRLPTRRLWGVLLVLPLLLGTSQARAGALDVALAEHSPDVLAFLKKKGWQNVGVLPFKVQRGNRSASYSGGPLSHNITQRLENALILSMGSNEVQAIGVVRDATATANKAGVGSYLSSAEALKKLFSTKYPLAWGDRSVEVQAFLTGKVTSSGSDRGKARVIIHAFDAKARDSGKFTAHRIKEFDVRLDRTLAADLGYNFALDRSVVMARGSKDWTARKRDEVALDELTLDDEGPQQPQQPQQPGNGQSKERTPLNIAGFAFELHYNGMQQELTPVSQQTKGSLAPEYLAPPAPPGSRVNLILTRVSEDDAKLGVVMQVNGRSIWAEETLEPIACRKWVYALERKGIRDDYAGFYYDVSGKNLRPFKVLSAEDSEAKAMELGNKAGWIDIHVFASGEKVKQEPEMLVSLRGRPQKWRSLAQVQAELEKMSHLRKKPVLVLRREGGLIINEMEPVEGGNLGTDDLPNPELIGHLGIRYWEGGEKTTQP